MDSRLRGNDRYHVIPTEAGIHYDIATNQNE